MDPHTIERRVLDTQDWREVVDHLRLDPTVVSRSHTGVRWSPLPLPSPACAGVPELDSSAVHRPPNSTAVEFGNPSAGGAPRRRRDHPRTAAGRGFPAYLCDRETTVASDPASRVRGQWGRLITALQPTTHQAAILRAWRPHAGATPGDDRHRAPRWSADPVHSRTGPAVELGPAALLHQWGHWCYRTRAATRAVPWPRWATAGRIARLRSRTVRIHTRSLLSRWLMTATRYT